jgi:hypothetical protein
MWQLQEGLEQGVTLKQENVIFVCGYKQGETLVLVFFLQE